MDVTFTDLTWTPLNCTSTIQYAATLYDGQPLPSEVTFFPSNHSFAIFTSDTYASATYAIKVTSTLIDWVIQNSTSFTWNLLIKRTAPIINDKYVIKEVDPPSFSAPIIDKLSIYTGNTSFMELPKVLMVENHTYSIKVSATGEASVFTQYVESKNSIMFQPDLGFNGTYKVNLVLRDEKTIRNCEIVFYLKKFVIKL